MEKHRLLISGVHGDALKGQQWPESMGKSAERWWAWGAMVTRALHAGEGRPAHSLLWWEHRAEADRKVHRPWRQHRPRPLYRANHLGPVLVGPCISS